MHCVAYIYAGVILGWKPGQASKFRPILANQETLTDFHGDEARNFQNGQLKKAEFFKTTNSQYF